VALSTSGIRMDIGSQGVMPEDWRIYWLAGRLLIFRPFGYSLFALVTSSNTR